MGNTPWRCKTAGVDKTNEDINCAQMHFWSKFGYSNFDMYGEF